MIIDPLYFSVFDEQANKWGVIPGEYKVQAGPASDQLPLTGLVKLGN